MSPVSSLEKEIVVMESAVYFVIRIFKQRKLFAKLSLKSYMVSWYKLQFLIDNLNTERNNIDDPKMSTYGISAYLFNSTVISPGQWCGRFQIYSRLVQHCFMGMALLY